MVSTRRPALPPSVHVELFVTERSRRNRVRGGCIRLYSVVRPLTRSDGGFGPHLFLLEAKPRPRRRPENLREAIGARPNEDVWLELTFYPSPERGKQTLRKLRQLPRVAQLAEKVEGLNLRRKRMWTLAAGELQRD